MMNHPFHNRSWYKKRWKERRVKVGYLCWLAGLFIAITTFEILQLPFLGIHFFGLYLVARYHWFANEVKE